MDSGHTCWQVEPAESIPWLDTVWTALGLQQYEPAKGY